MLFDRTILCFGLITCFVSWMVWSCLLFRTRVGRLLIDLETDPILIPIMILGGIIPSVVGLSFTYYRLGNIQSYLRETFSFRKLINLPKICFIALFIPIIVNMISFVAMHAIFPLKLNLLDIIKERIGPGLVMGICASLGEEFGWRGFALAHLVHQNNSKTTLEKSQIIKIGIYIGMLWSVWHTFGNYIALGHFSSFPLIIFMNAFVNLTNYSIIMSLLYVISGGNMLLEVAFHSLISFSSFTLYHNNSTEMEQVVDSFLGCTLSLTGMLLIARATQFPRT